MTRSRPLADRLCERVKRLPSGCLVWTGRCHKAGYGIITAGGRHGRKLLTHRVAWVLTNGPIPSETPCVLHHCDNPPCCEPNHLFLGTRADNAADRERKGRGKPGRGRLQLNLPRAEIAARYRAGGVTQDHLAAEYGCSPSTIHRIARRGS